MSEWQYIVSLSIDRKIEKLEKKSFQCIKGVIISLLLKLGASLNELQEIMIVCIYSNGTGVSCKYHRVRHV